MNFLLYDAKVAVALLVFYLFYRFLLKKETFHRFNRVVLVGTGAAGILPVLSVPAEEGNLPQVQPRGAGGDSRAVVPATAVHHHHP